jgi:hypothetical protein
MWEWQNTQIIPPSFKSVEWYTKFLNHCILYTISSTITTAGKSTVGQTLTISGHVIHSLVLCNNVLSGTAVT